jgi:hypothetical protein
MRKIIPLAVLAALAAASLAEGDSRAASTGGMGTNIGNGTTDGLVDTMAVVQLDKAPAGTSPSDGSVQSPPRYMAVISDSANIRRAPRVESELLATVPRGAWVTVIGSSDGWAHVQGKGFDGYIDHAQLAEVAPFSGARTSQPSYQSSSPSSQPSPQPAPQPSPQPSAQPPSASQAYPGYQIYPAAPSYQPTPIYQYQTGVPARQYPPSGQAYAPETRVVNSGGGTIHETPDPRSPLLGILPPGYQVPVLGTVNGNWAHVVVNGIDGYMRDNQLQ